MSILVWPVALSSKSLQSCSMPGPMLGMRSGVWGGPKCRIAWRRARSWSGGSDTIMLG
jgi:hypothetical protein